MSQTKPHSEVDHKAIRTWMRRRGMTPPKRGPVPQKIIDSYNEWMRLENREPVEAERD